MSILKEIQAMVPNCTYHVTVGVGGMRRHIELYEIDLSPEYQRDYVWTEKQESSFVGAILENHRSIPPFWFNWTNDRSSGELVDGKQRIKSILRWLDEEIVAACPCGIDVWHKNLDIIDLRNVNINTTMDWNFVELSQMDVMKFYLRLNSGGTIHTEEELDRVRGLVDEITEAEGE